jgi:hypothetical protein
LILFSKGYMPLATEGTSFGFCMDNLGDKSSPDKITYLIALLVAMANNITQRFMRL